ncbi:FAD:protein FMN transferase [Saccharicrinis sp. FJH62]|uniref:FAD:protein FMN transferase n=1 Tax=Saccharicrinis sp. FJH62 TaxID=3344657 RepID=UPI0035D4CA7C
MKFFLICIAAVLSVFTLSGQNKLMEHKQDLTLMGTAFEICALHEDPEVADEAIRRAIIEISRIEELISSYRSNSQTSQVNNMSGIKPVKVDPELYDLVERSLKLSRLTDGAFDISYAVTDKLWDFKSGYGKVPDHARADSLKSLIDYHNIILNQKDTTIFLKKKGMRIGFGAIGKGYAANRAKGIMTALGIENGYVDASGDILFWGSNNGEPWKVGLASPDNRSKALGWLEVSDMAVVTSGDYVYHIQTDTANLSHIIDPKSGWPVEKMRSVTIICPDAELADGLATSVSVLGPETGLMLINKLRGVECILITGDNRMLTSEHASIIKE